MKLEDAKKRQNVFKSNLNEISTERCKSGEQKSVLKNIKLLYESEEAAVELFDDYSSILSEAKYKTTYGKEIPRMLECVAHLAKVSDHSNLKTLSLKKCFTNRLPIALAQVKAGNTSENLLNEMKQIIYSLYRAKDDNIMNSIKLQKQNRYYICEF